MRKKTIILIVLVGVIVIILYGLAYSGVMIGDPIVPDSCIFPAGFNCEDHMVEKNKIRLLITHELGQDIILRELTFTETSSNPLHLCEMRSGEIIISQGVPVTITAGYCPVSNVQVGNKYKYSIDFTFRYLNSETEHKGKGELLDVIWA